MRERLVLLALLLLAAAALKAEFSPGLGRNSLDGNYYYQVARHIEEGRGLQTGVSLYHQGLTELPHPTNIYPGWPLLLGWTARFTGLPAAAAVLPELLFLLDLVLLWALANRLGRRVFGGAEPFVLRGGRVLDLGHLAVLLFATNPVFFNFTSLPYTEALAFAWSFAALLALDRAAPHGALPAPALVWSAAAGGLAGLAFVTRSQAVGVILGVVLALALAGLRQRRYLGGAALAAAAFAVCVAPWAAWLASWVEPFDPRVMLSIGAYRELPEIVPFQWNRPATGTWQYLADRASGLWAAFDPTNPTSYVASFGLAAWLVPLAVAGLAARGHDRWAAWRAAVQPGSAAVVAAVVAAAVQLAPLQLMHTRYLGEWRFGHRHGLALLLLLVPALAYLLDRGPRPWRWAALALAVASLASGGFATASLLGARFPSGLLGPEPELVEWLEARRPRPTVVTTNAQTLAVYSRAGFHWMQCDEDPAKTRLLIERAGVDHVLVYSGQEHCRFHQGIERLTPVASFGEGRRRITVLAVAEVRR